MNNKILENNLKLISKYNKDLAEKISNIFQLKNHYEIKEAKSGDSILYINGIAFDDGFDPVWNALEKYNKLQDNTPKSISVLYGLGLGYILKEFAKRYKGKIILYEPELESLRVAFELVDFSQELGNKNIRITSNYEEIRSAYLELFFKDYKLNIVPINYYENNDFQQILEFKDQVEKIHGVYQSNYKNLMEKGARWAKGLFNNIENVIENQDLHVLKNKYKDKTAVIISAGPSLDKNINDLKPYRDKVVIFCVGTALKTAIKHGIMPDFVVVIEISPNTKKQIDIPQISDLKVISATNIFKGVFDIKPKCFLNYHQNKESSSQWLAKVLQVPLDDYETAGTVSINALYTAKMLGADKIIFIGQDLAYTNNRCYSKDSDYGFYELDDKKKISAPEEKKHTSQAEMLGKDLYYIKGHNGEKVLSRSDLILFITYFEEIAGKFGSEIKFINSTEGGAYIKGFEHIPLKQALENYANSEFNKEIPMNLLKLDNRELKKRKNLINNELRAIIKNYYEIKDIIAYVVKNILLTAISPQTSCRYEHVKQLFEKFYKNEFTAHLNNSSLSADEQQLKKERIEAYEDFVRLALRDIEILLKENPTAFAEGLKTIKDNYLVIKEGFYKNVLFNNLYITYFLIISNMVRDFEENDENMVELFKALTSTFFFIDNTLPEYIRFVKEIMNRISK